MRRQNIFLRLLTLICAIVFLSHSNLYTYTPTKGDRLVYVAKYLNFIPFGKVEIGIKDITKYDNKDVFLIECKAKTAKWISLLFKAEAYLKSFVDIERLYPYKFEQVIKVAGKEDDVRTAYYDRENNIMNAIGKGKKRVPSDVRDPLSAIYYLRTNLGDEHRTVTQIVNNNQSNYIFKAEIKGKRKVKDYTCLIVDSNVRRENKSMYHSLDVTFYITNTNEKIPLVIKAKTNVGPISLILLKHS